MRCIASSCAGVSPTSAPANAGVNTTSVSRIPGCRGAVRTAIPEPTCGVGNLLFAAIDAFPGATAIGADVDAGYVRAVRACGVEAHHESFFDAPWGDRIARLPEPILVIGNPPWVTNADAGAN